MVVSHETEGCLKLTETVIVNRTPETVGQKIETERLVQAELSNQSAAVTATRVAPETVMVSTLAGPRTAEAVRAEQIGNIELPQTLLTSEILEALRATSSIKNRDRDQDFQTKVIAAFKHLGLDTAKFFGV